MRRFNFADYFFDRRESGFSIALLHSLFTPVRWKEWTRKSRSSNEKHTAFTTCATLPWKSIRLSTSESEKASFDYLTKGEDSLSDTIRRLIQPWGILETLMVLVK